MYGKIIFIQILDLYEAYFFLNNFLLKQTFLREVEKKYEKSQFILVIFQNQSWISIGIASRLHQKYESPFSALNPYVYTEK